MSGGTPVGSASMRQRHSQGYFSGNEDLEDDASSRMCRTPPPIPRARTWIEVMENVLWLASAAFIIYFGDRNSNFIYVLWKDERIKRIALYLGLLCTLLNLVIILFTTLFSWDLRRVDEKLELLNPSTAPIITLLGLLSFCLLSFALWPIWSFLTLPLLFTLFMAFMVMLPYLPTWTFHPEAETFRTD